MSFSVVELLRKSTYNHYVSGRNWYIIYAHYLEQPIHQALRKPSIDDINGSMIIGELIHSGFAKMIGGCREQRKTVFLDRDIANRALREARRFITCNDNYCWVTVSGTPDACIINSDGVIPLELKTTRSNNVRLYWKWRHRLMIYNWLLDAPYGYVVVINIIDGSEKTFKVDKAFTADEIRDIIARWLMGEYPSWALDKKLGGDRRG